ncbi:MAG TPA: hypothetical protein VMI12_08970 [Puia sp.]|nr:hypothetical protein [Puia sp.]
MKKMSNPGKIFLIATLVLIVSVLSVSLFQILVQAFQKISASIPIVHN